MCRLYGKFAAYLGRVLCKTRVIFPRINDPNITRSLFTIETDYPPETGYSVESSRQADNRLI